MQNLIKHPSSTSPGFGSFCAVGAKENRFDQFKVPVAETPPGKLVEAVGGVVEPESIERVVAGIGGL